MSGPLLPAELGVQRLLALDRIQDPGNLGTLLRTALAFGWDGVYLLPGCADAYGDKAIRSSRGAALRVACGRGDLAGLRAVAAAHRLTLLAAEPEPEGDEPTGQQQQQDPEGNNLLPASPGVCLVLGSEGQGLSPEVLAACQPVAIPMYGAEPAAGASGTHLPCMESLNVGVAGGILMFMLSRGMPQLLARLGSLVGRREGGGGDRTHLG